ncbi:type IV secretion system protein [Asticcacaulis sp. W401b]|uniref:type IV secretion system protein n=1 Tax=Asticcacaulis sp. W401b TaxID=3388666 RepID=UPI003970F636
MGIATDIELAMDMMLANYVSEKSAAVCAMLAPVALVGITIYVIMMGYSVARGEVRHTLMTPLWKLVKLGFVVTVALSVGQFQSMILNAFYGIQDGMIGAFSQSGSVGGTIDEFMEPYNELSRAIGQEASNSAIPDLTLYLALAIVAISQAVLFAVGIGMVVLAKVALTLVMAIGPAFILCAAFPATQRFTESWIGQVLNYILLNILVVAAFVMLTFFAQQFADRALATYNDDSQIIKDCTALLIVSAALVVVMLNLNAIASALGGGASIAGATQAAGAAGQGLMAVGGAVVGLGASLMGKAAKAYSNRKKGGSIAPGGGQGVAASSGASNDGPGTSPLYQKPIVENLRRSAST